MYDIRVTIELKYANEPPVVAALTELGRVGITLEEIVEDLIHSAYLINFNSIPDIAALPILEHTLIGIYENNAVSSNNTLWRGVNTPENDLDIFQMRPETISVNGLSLSSAREYINNIVLTMAECVWWVGRSLPMVKLEDYVKDVKVVGRFQTTFHLLITYGTSLIKETQWSR